MKRILVFTPTASRGGSEISLLNLIKHSDPALFAFHVVAGQEGSLLYEFSEVAEVSVIPSSKDRKWQIAQKVLRNTIRYDLDLKYIRTLHEKYKPDFWYINTSVMPHIASIAIEMNAPYLVHFHELLSVYDQMKGHTFRKMIEHSSLNLCCSEKIKSYLDEFNASKNKVFNKQVSFEGICADSKKSTEIKERLGLSQYTFLWVMSGATSPRKGFDLFIDIATLRRDSAFLWIGKQRDHGYNEVLKQLVKNHELNNIRFVDEQKEEYSHFLNCADGFLLTSREDPFPTVMIEAAYLGKPIVAFNSGGSKEFIKEKMGFVVDHLNVQEMLNKIDKTENDSSSFSPDYLKEMAEKHDVILGAIEWQKHLNEIQL